MSVWKEKKIEKKNVNTIIISYRVFNFNTIKIIIFFVYMLL